MTKPKKSSVQKQPIKIHTIPQVDNKVEVVDFYNDLLSSMQYPVTKNFIMKLRENWIRWAKEDNTAMNPSQFIMDAGIHWGTAMRWCKKFPELEEAYDIVKRCIGLRSEKKLIESNPKELSFMLPSYLDEYAQQHEWRSSLRNKELETQKTHITVVIPDMEKKDN